jgi:ribosomal-protein-alanine N-acetyltransferase
VTDALAGPLVVARVTVGADADADLDEIAALQASTFTHPWGVEALRWEIANSDVARLYTARTSDAALVAYCACWVLFDELHINSLAVVGACRRRGVARRLLLEIFRQATASGVTKATLEVRESNVAARTFYAGLGFSVEATRRDYYRDPREDALVLWNRDLVLVLPAREGLW